nr:immunoglobulin heavy chain junction region [Macaca mulatta]MOX38722.1 immunoglobulin heavy chain junction region [Macaca mulatta]MOX39237.1 immunoglobulin heavy chain junction region [Macaca mulatta]MOX39264.1 immunoglobulin heavy chain junction region [Macaca mulatta]MOX39924.1 immunoglobulin heavy chain junction region [Macaca mulatta]
CARHFGVTMVDRW